VAIGELCNREVIITGPATSVAEAARLMRRHHVGDVVVVDDDERRRPVAIVTDRDIVIEVIAAGLNPEDVTVMDIVTDDLTVVSVNEEFLDALAQMRQRGVRRLPIVNADGGLEGILTADDAVELVGEAVADLVSLVSRELDREKTTRSGG
jgi:CBS domain-containing protein